MMSAISFTSLLENLSLSSGVYQFHNLHAVGELVYTNTMGTSAFRGFGNMQTHYAVESMMDMLAQELNGQIINSIQVIGSTITLRYKEIQAQILNLIKKHKPDIIINLGQATRPSISIEKIAINLADAGRIAYNCGSKPDEEKLIRDAPDAYFSSLPVKKLVSHLEKNKIKQQNT